MVIERTDMNEPGDRFHQVTIERVTDSWHREQKAVVYPNYCNRIRVKMHTPGLGFEIEKEDAIALVEVLQAALRSME